MNDLLEMLTYKRPNRSQSEAEYIKKYIAPVTEQDDFGNYICAIGAKPEILFSSHTDTVHKKDGKQPVFVDTKANQAFVEKDCLGADDGTGNWIMLEMIKQKVPGLYIFHRGEECGGLGSTFISKHEQPLLAGIKHAVAFDRAYHSDIITSQSSGKCCSDMFADALAARLGTGWQGTWGTFTDTANYNHLIPECTNISVGYLHQHTKEETQDLDFALWLRETCVSLDWEKLPVERDVTDMDDGWGWGTGGYGRGYGSSYGSTQTYKGNPGLARWDAVMTFIEANPDIVADYLIDTGVRLSELRNYTWQLPAPADITDGDDDEMTVAEYYRTLPDLDDDETPWYLTEYLTDPDDKV